MEMGGFGGYSKYNVIKRFPPHLIPRTLFVQAAIYPPAEVLQLLEQNSLKFPLIVKPDVGERGWKVEKIDTFAALIEYLTANPQPLLIQEYIPYPLELGIMYHRLPGQRKGHITSVVQKEFLSVTADGKSSLRDLFNQFTRTRYHLPMLLKLYEHDLDKVFPAGEALELVSIGNHCRGTTFLNGNHLITPALEEIFDSISEQIDGFYFGRYDIRVPSLTDLYAGQNIKILELNGANSEPAHIYDPHMSLSRAYRHLFTHWRTLFEVSMQNSKQGIRFMPFGKAISIIRNRKLPNYIST
jgi:hypothetical protein